VADIIHDESHLLLLPRKDERETFDRLDHLLQELLEARVSPSVAATLISEHIALLTANLQRVPQIGQRAVLDTSYPNVIRWMQLALGAEIDRWLIKLFTADNCGECGRLWALHLVEARSVINDWATDREFRFQHDRNG
jgi:hypothetical protein